MTLRALLITALLGLLAGAPVHAEVDRFDAFKSIPVQEGGREMPLDTYARLKLLQYSGKSTLEGEPAVRWLADVFFAPESVASRPFFLINHPEVLEAIGVDVEDGRRRFTFHELHAGLEKLFNMAQKAFQVPDDERTPVEKEIMRVYHNLSEFSQLQQAFRFTEDMRAFEVEHASNRELLGLPEGRDTFTFLDIYLRGGRLAGPVQALSEKDPETWTEPEQELFRLSSMLFQMSRHHAGLPPAMMPVHGHGNEQWVGPWDVLSMQFLTDRFREELEALGDMAAAYRAGSQAEFDMAARAYQRSVMSRVTPTRALDHIDLELLYNRLKLYYRAEILYGLAFLLGLAGMMLERRWVLRGAWALAALGLVPHTLAMIWRMMIMGRPPMTNLYATFVFVAWVCVVLGLAVEWFQRNGLGSVISGISGLSLLMVSSKFAAQGDTLGVVVAVLDSNFWLSTHVVTITIGYAGCVAAGLAGHIYLLQAFRRMPYDKRLKATARAVYGLLAFGLIFSFLGTMLGGVWADQSWGRFWGWDPKENGALLIVLWTAMIFHARISNWIGDRGVAAMSVLGVIVVLMAWLGINLLGVGLHSYGFTSGVALGLWISIAVEIVFVCVTAPFAKKIPVTAKPVAG